MNAVRTPWLTFPGVGVSVKMDAAFEIAFELVINVMFMLKVFFIHPLCSAFFFHSKSLV